MGALTAYMLAGHGIPFTWHDIERGTAQELQVSPTDFHTAWHASTGAVFPTGKPEDIRCLQQYEDELLQYLPEAIVKECGWVYGAKKAPHEAKQPVLKEHKGLKMLDATSYHFDVQNMVRRARMDFSHCELSTAKAKAKHAQGDFDLYFVAHGWSSRRQHAYWGWTRLVKLDVDEELGPHNAFYFRKGRFKIRYAYPVGDRGLWYAGSTITMQKHLGSKTERLQKEYEAWKEDFLELCNGAVRITSEEDFIEGWRPAAGKMSEDNKPEFIQLQKFGDGVYRYPCRSHDGIRRFPDIWNQVAKLIGEK